MHEGVSLRYAIRRVYIMESGGQSWESSAAVAAARRRLNGAGTWPGTVLEVPESRQQVAEDLPRSLRKISNQASMSHHDALTSARIAATSAGTGSDGTVPTDRHR